MENVRETLQDKDKMYALVGTALTMSGGVAKGAFGLVGMGFAICLDALLTLFFFSFFLRQMSRFHVGHEQKSVGQYVVEGIFQSGWMPRTSEETQEGARDILDTVVLKLQTWVRGYLSLIIIESMIYVTVFLLLQVPYALLLGLVAGMAVLLPFLGALASTGLTIVVAWVGVGGIDFDIFVKIALVYIVMNMLIEQLFLYPVFVGEALGLNVLETLIVVLLGGLFAGLAGMIFAVPATSVLKYLIPRVYRTWPPRQQNAPRAAGDA